jgi:hypothetical protein
MASRGTIAVGWLVVCFVLSLANAAGPASQPTTAPATDTGSWGIVSGDKYRALKEDRDRLAEQLVSLVERLGSAEEQVARLEEENAELRRALRASTRPARE